MIHRGSLAALILALSVITGCGGGGGGNGSPQPPQPPTPPMDVQAPTAQILFPPAVSATETSTITVRGTASDNGTVNAVRVNGVLATTSDAFGTWQAVVPLVPGQNTLTVEATDAANNRNAVAAQAVIARTAQLTQVGGVGVDAANHRAFVYDYKAAALFAVDLVTGLRTLVSPDQLNQGSNGTRISFVAGIVLDSAHNRALVLDPSLSGIVAINLDTGSRTLLTGTGVPNDSNPLVGPSDIALDEKHGRALVTDGSLVVAVSLADGSRTVLSSPGIPDNVNSLVSAKSIVVDAINNRALVADNRAQFNDGRPNAVIAVSLTDGSRTVFSDASTPNDINPLPATTLADLALDRQRNRLLVAEPFAGVLIGISLVDGSRSTVANTVFANVIEVDASGNRALVVNSQDFARSGIVAVNLDNGLASVVTDPSLPPATAFGAPTDVVIDAVNQRLLVLDAQLNQVIAINMGPGAARSVLAQLPATLSTNAPFALALDRANNRALVTRALQDVVAVDLATGTTSVLMNSGVSASLSGLAVDEANRRAFLGEVGRFDSAPRLFTTDLSDPLSLSPAVLATLPPSLVDRFLFAADPLNLSPAVPLMAPYRLTVDATSGRLLASASSVVLVTSPNDPMPVMLGFAPGGFGSAFLTGIAVDTTTNQAVVADATSRSVFAVSLVDGSFSTVLTGRRELNALAFPEGLALDSVTGRIFVADFQAGTVFVIDRVTGERVFL